VAWGRWAAANKKRQLVWQVQSPPGIGGESSEKMPNELSQVFGRITYNPNLPDCQRLMAIGRPTRAGKLHRRKSQLMESKLPKSIAEALRQHNGAISIRANLEKVAWLPKDFGARRSESQLAPSTG
jgi:hypothetical protein